jgi:hypothetical protein
LWFIKEGHKTSFHLGNCQSPIPLYSTPVHVPQGPHFADMAMCKEATETRWIQMAGKPNKDFLAKPKRVQKCIGDMTIDNIKDEPDLPRMDDINIILQNFVNYYAKLYEHKAVCPLALNRLIANLILNLNDKDVKELEAPIKKGKILRALVVTPKGKSPGTNHLPYECYKECPNKAALILASISNKVADTSTHLPHGQKIFKPEKFLPNYSEDLLDQNIIASPDGSLGLRSSAFLVSQ